MSNSDDDYRVGNKRPPLHTRFQKGNKAARGRRRKASGKSQIVEGLRDGLQQEISVQKNGKSQRAPLSYVLGKQTAQQLAQAPLPVRIKALADLKKYGLLELFDGEAQLDQERAEFEEEKREFNRQQRDCEVINTIARELADCDKLNLRCAYELLSQLKEGCNCNTLAGEALETYERLGDIVVSSEEAEELAASVDLRALLAGEYRSADDQPEGNDLADGMLGSE